MSNLTLSHRATTILYTPSTYAFDNASTGWLSTSSGHSTLLPNASFQIDWTGQGIHVDGEATGNGTVLLSLDGGTFTPVQVNQSRLVDYDPPTFGDHSLVVGNVPGQHLTVTGYTLLDVREKRLAMFLVPSLLSLTGFAGLIRTSPTVTTRELSSTVQNETGSWVQNPEFMWVGEWAVQRNVPLSSKPSSPPTQILYTSQQQRCRTHHEYETHHALLLLLQRQRLHAHRDIRRRNHLHHSF
jgi:hypothetical protein